MKIQVTQEDIDNGLRFDTRCCPVALAVHRVVKVDDVVAGPGMIIIRDQRLKLSCVTPEKVKSFMGMFDLNIPGISPKPFSFELTGLENFPHAD